MNNVQNDNSQPLNLDVDGAADVILGQWTDGEDLSEDTEDEDTQSQGTDETDVDEDELEEDDEAGQDEDSPEDPDADELEDEDDQSEDDEDEDEEPLAASDDQLVEIAVNGKSKKVSVKDLKRLYGQEASLTKKSQDLAHQRKASDESLVQTQLSYEKLMERAEARYKPYADIDMLVASRQMDPDTFAQLRIDAKQAEEDLTFLKEESGQLVSQMKQQQQQFNKEAAQECVKVLQDQLPDWGNELYADIRNYAVKSGMPQEAVDQYTDPQVIMLINKARLYDLNKESAKGKKAKAKLTKSKDGRTKVLSSKKAPPNKASSTAKKRQEAIAGLHGHSDLDDIASALMSGWSD